MDAGWLVDAGEDLITEAESNRILQQRQQKEQLMDAWEKQQSRQLTRHQLSTGAVHVAGHDTVNAPAPQFDPSRSDTWNMRLKVRHVDVGGVGSLAGL